MTLTTGTRIGPYEVRSALGAGGMGEVYRAHDTTLGRDVAIKILPEAFADDPERIARFEREAKTLAALNHPNIAQIYVRPFPDVNGGRWQISARGGLAPAWTRNGRELHYMTADRRLMAVPIQSTSGFTFGSATTVADLSRSAIVGIGRSYDTSADGKRILILKADQQRGGADINVVLNWFEELKRLVPLN